MAELTPKQTRIVKAKVEGRENIAIGAQEYPNATPRSQSVLISRELRKVNVQEAIQEEFKKQGIDLETVLKPVVKALKARKGIFNEETKQYEIGDDIELQLKGHDRAAKLMGLNQQVSGEINVTYIDASNNQRDSYEI